MYENENKVCVFTSSEIELKLFAFLSISSVETDKSRLKYCRKYADRRHWMCQTSNSRRSVYENVNDKRWRCQGKNMTIDTLSVFDRTHKNTSFFLLYFLLRSNDDKMELPADEEKKAHEKTTETEMDENIWLCKFSHKWKWHLNRFSVCALFELSLKLFCCWKFIIWVANVEMQFFGQNAIATKVDTNKWKLFWNL